MDTIEAKIKAEEEEAKNQIVKGFEEGTYFRVGDLDKAFDKVKDKTNWKNAINTSVWATVSEITVIREAIIFFTGSVPHLQIYSHDGDKMLFHVVAAGYYNAIGA